MNALLPALLSVLVVAGETPKPGEAQPIGGKPLHARTQDGDTWRAGPCRITTPLPAGYPAPTVPGAIELKAYPAIRKAETTAAFGPELGRNLAFWKLFRHIERREIAMTAPVEMRLEPSPQDAKALAGWTMAFLYREPTLGELGADGDVAVVAEEPMVVLSIGVQGDYSTGRALAEAEMLRAALAKLAGWRASGPPRALFYNGPDVRDENRWAEIQLPVERVPEPAPAPRKPAKRRVV